MRIFSPADLSRSSQARRATMQSAAKIRIKSMNRLYTVESFADHHRHESRASAGSARQRGAGICAPALAAAVGAPGAYRLRVTRGPASSKKFLAALAKDLKANAGKSAVIPGCIRMRRVAALAAWPSTRRWAMSARRSRSPRRPCNPLPSDQIGDLKNAGRRSECGQSRLAGDSRCQSRLLRACRSGLC